MRSHQSTATGVFKAGEECVFKTDPPKTSSSQTDEIIHSKTRQYHHDRVKAADEALQALRSRYKEKREAAAAATASYTATARTWHKHHPTRQYESRDHPPPRPCPGDDSQRDEAQTYSSGVLETERQRNESDDGSRAVTRHQRNGQELKLRLAAEEKVANLHSKITDMDKKLTQLRGESKQHLHHQLQQIEKIYCPIARAQEEWKRLRHQHDELVHAVNLTATKEDVKLLSIAKVPPNRCRDH